MYLRARVRITRDVAAFAARVAGNVAEPFEVGRKIFSGIVDHLSYDKTIPGCAAGDTAWIMRHAPGLRCRAGICHRLDRAHASGCCIRWLPNCDEHRQTSPSRLRCPSRRRPRAYPLGLV